MENIYRVWNKRVRFDDLKLSLQGDAVAGRFSCFWIPELKIMFDAGIQSDFNPEHIFITHTHADHVYHLPNLLTDITSEPVVYVPQGMKIFVKRYLDSHIQLNRGSDKVGFKVNIKEVTPGEQINLTIANRQYIVKVFKTSHRIVSCGYAISEIKKKLKQEYLGLNSNEIVALKKSNIEITYDIVKNIIVYTGDTKNSIFDNTDTIDWNSYSIILTECTYIKSLSEEADEIDSKCKSRGHNCFEYLTETRKKYPDPIFLLCHISLRYPKKQQQEFFENYKDVKIIPWINNYEDVATQFQENNTDKSVDACE